MNMMIGEAMCTKNLLKLAIVIISVASCTMKEVAVEDVLFVGDDYVYATFESYDTKVFADEYYRPCWEEDDSISVFDHTSLNLRYRFAGTPGEPKGAFVATYNEDDYDTSNVKETEYVYAVYPYDVETRTEIFVNPAPGLFLYHLPGIQYYREGTFGKGANSMFAVSEDHNLVFKNLCGYLVLKFYGTDIDVISVALRGNNNESLSGKTFVQTSPDYSPSLSYVNAGSSITLLCETPVSLKGDKEDCTDFWFVVPPHQFEKGFSATVVAKDGRHFIANTSKSIEIARNQVTKMSPLEVVLDSQPTDFIVFADGNVKDALLAKGLDTDGDGEISFEEAKSLTEVEYDFFADYSDYVTTFNEFKYFTSVKRIGEGAFRDCSLREITLPESLESIGYQSFIRCRDLKSINIPDSVENIEDWAFSQNSSLEQAHLPDGLLSIGEFAFSSCVSLREINIPLNIKELPVFIFGNCEKLTSIHIPENITKVGSQAFTACTSLSSVTGCNGLKTIDDRAFEKCAAITEFHIPESVENLGEGPFWGCKNLVRFTGKFVEDGGRSVIVGDRYVAAALSSFTEKVFEFPSTIKRIGQLIFCEADLFEKIIIPDGIRSIGRLAFYECRGLKEVVIPSSLTEYGDQVFSGSGVKSVVFPEGTKELLESICNNCQYLEHVTIPSTVKEIQHMAFSNCPSLVEVVCKPSTPPVFTTLSHYPLPLFDGTPSSMQIQIPSGSLVLYQQAYEWSKYANQYVEVDFPDVEEPDYYISSDYSKDGTSFIIQTATEGTGIDVVIMGDCFVDRDIDNGTYRKILEKAVDGFFSIEPLTSFRDYFNVYGVNVVSSTEGYSHALGRLGTWFKSGTHVGGEDHIVQQYASYAKPSIDENKTLVIVLMNRYYYAGTCYMYFDYAIDTDYGLGTAIAYVPLGENDNQFRALILHEAAGHGFGKLTDEYCYDGTIPQNEIDSFREVEPYGWFKNVDFTPNPSEVKWRAFLNDARYSDENLGVYEGAATYAYGAYRPSEESMMNHNIGDFNAPSRYAIWYKIGKLAHGDDWSGTYEDFVSFDRNRKNNANNMSYSAKPKNFVERNNYIPLHPPVVIHR